MKKLQSNNYGQILQVRQQLSRQQLSQQQLPHQQQQAHIPSAEEIKGKWKQQVGSAKIVWGKLTEDELLKLEGHQQRLTGLVQERYALSLEEADRQVKAFFDKH
jgi:uncharacterized protein YjbJ (UPF0337 family)